MFTGLSGHFVLDSYAESGLVIDSMNNYFVNI